MPVEAQVLMSEPPSSSCLANITFPAASKVADLSPYWPSINIWIQDPSAVRKAGEQISREMYTEMCSIGRVVTPVGTWYQGADVEDGRRGHRAKMDGVTRNVLHADNRAPVPVGLVRRPFGVAVVHLSTHETHVAAAIAYVNFLTLHGEFKIPADVHGNFRVSAKSVLVKEELDEKFLRDFGLAELSLAVLAPDPVPPHRMALGPVDSVAQSLSENRLLSCGARCSATPCPIPDVKVCFRNVLSAPDLPDSPIFGP